MFRIICSLGSCSSATLEDRLRRNDGVAATHITMF